MNNQNNVKLCHGCGSIIEYSEYFQDWKCTKCWTLANNGDHIPEDKIARYLKNHMEINLERTFLMGKHAIRATILLVGIDPDKPDDEFEVCSDFVLI